MNQDDKIKELESKIARLEKLVDLINAKVDEVDTHASNVFDIHWEAIKSNSNNIDLIAENFKHVLEALGAYLSEIRNKLAED